MVSNEERIRVIHRRYSALLASASLLLTVAGCGLLPVDEPANTPPIEDSASDDAQPGSANGLRIARSEDEASGQREVLLEGGHATVIPENLGYYMDILTVRLRQDLAHSNVAVHRDQTRVTLTFPGAASFDTNSAELHPAMRDALDAIARVLEEYHASLITIAGHTDNSGSRDYNLQLSEQRAVAVGRHLRNTGIATERMVAIGFGPDRPVAANHTPEGQARNRRVELMIEPLVAT